MTLQIREILFATDFSDAARQAGHTAADLARQFRARLHVLYVSGACRDRSPAPSVLGGAADALGPGLRALAVTVAGTAAREIAAYAASHDIDLIVIGTHRRTGVSRALLGSVGEAVVRRATCPVLTVPARRQATAATAAEPERCVVCAAVSDELICGLCRALIRGESLRRKMSDERTGHRGDVGTSR